MEKELETQSSNLEGLSENDGVDQQQELPLDGIETKEVTEQPEQTEAEDKSGVPNDIPQELSERYKSMQSDYTKKTQALAEERKQFKAELEAAKKSQETLNTLVNNPKFQAWYQQAILEEQQPKEPEVVKLTDDELYEAQQDPNKMQELIDRRVMAQMKRFESQLSQVSQTVETQRTAEMIRDYATQPGNEDFNELNELGFITPIAKDLAERYPREPYSNIVKAAHKEARRIAQAAQAKVETKYKTQLEQKKNAVIPRGGNSNRNVVKTTATSISDIGMEVAARMGYK